MPPDIRIINAIGNSSTSIDALAQFVDPTIVCNALFGKTIDGIGQSDTEEPEVVVARTTAFQNGAFQVGAFQ